MQQILNYSLYSGVKHNFSNRYENFKPRQKRRGAKGSRPQRIHRETFAHGQTKNNNWSEKKRTKFN